MNEQVEENPFTNRLTEAKPAPKPPKAIASKEPIEIGPDGLILTKFEQVWRIADMLWEARQIPTGFINRAQVMTALLKALELKLPPLLALENMNIVGGRVGLSVALQLSMVERSGLLEDKQVKYTGEGEELACEVILQRKNRKPQSYTFSLKQGKKAGLVRPGSAWVNYPERMLYARALGFGLIGEFADVIKGIKSTEELEDYPESAIKEHDETVRNYKLNS